MMEQINMNTYVILNGNDIESNDTKLKKLPESRATRITYDNNQNDVMPGVHGWACNSGWESNNSWIFQAEGPAFGRLSHTCDHMVCLCDKICGQIFKSYHC